MKTVQIYDTTLRDGMQGIEISYSLQDKIIISRKLDEMKIDYIEGGFPQSSEKEAEFFKQLTKKKLIHAKLVAFGPTRKPKVKAKDDEHIQALLESEAPCVTVVGKAWKAHVKQVLKTELLENLAMIHDSIHYLVSRGREVFFDLEHFFDGYKDDPEYAVKVLKTGTEAGAEVLVLCDTNGGTLPSELIRIMEELPQKELKPLGVHFHNDAGVATANSLLALDHGAVHVQGTINGWGERTGNANLCAIIPNICLKTDYRVSVCERLTGLTSLSRFVAEKANIIPDKRQPYVGDASFSHKAGQHADVITKAPELMEHIDASLVGNERQILLSGLAGKSTIIKKTARYGDFDKDSHTIRELLRILKNKETDGYEYEAAEASFDILIRKTIERYTPLLFLKNYHLESFKTAETPSKTVGRLFLSSRGQELMGAAVGVGPVETLDKALRDALLPIQPFLSKISLIDYRVRVLNPQYATAAKVRVFITSTDHKRSWDTVGVSENIVEASWEALVDSLDYYYNNFVLEP
ncbi:MAG: citramalate synthase [Spirochaetales bacterium]|nr:MAG: citramalate synthase [Spirochaetales bacterium]